MALTSLAGYLAAPKHRIAFSCGAAASHLSSLTSGWFVAGLEHSAGSSPSNTTTGLVPTDATTGTIPLDFSGTGYITGAEFNYSETADLDGRVMLYDRLYHAGEFAINSTGTTTLSSQPSFSSRVGGDFSGLEVFLEGRGASGTTAATVNITYTNQSGVTGCTSDSVSTATGGGAAANRLFRIPLGAGDCGIQALESFVVSSAGSGSTWNVVIARRLLSVPYARSLVNNAVLWMDRTRAVAIPDDACLWVVPNRLAATCTLDLEITVP